MGGWVDWGGMHVSLPLEGGGEDLERVGWEGVWVGEEEEVMHPPRTRLPVGALRRRRAGR